MSNIWTYVGIALLGWVAWDLYAGYTLVWELVYRDENPGLYWAAVGAWAVLGLSCFFPWGSEEEIS